MCQMKYLYDYCNFQKYYEKAKRNQQKTFEAGYFPDTPIFDDAEYLALKHYGGYPTSYPWM